MDKEDIKLNIEDVIEDLKFLRKELDHTIKVVNQWKKKI